MKGMIVSVREENTYRIRRIRAYGKYFWVVKDAVKGCFLWSSGFWFGSVAMKFPLTLERDSMTKSEILLHVPGYFPNKKEAISCLEQGLRR